MNTCPCGSGKAYGDCCEPIINGTHPAQTAEQLMRARYSAHAVAQMDFIFESVHPDHRKGYDHQGTKEWAENSEWLGLEIIGAQEGGPEDETGQVEFIAHYRDGGVIHDHHECAMFQRKDGVWLFTDGVRVRPKPLIVEKIGRNDPCKCGSGIKYKKCCGK
jgi:SEC-C motif domain protein